MGNIKAKNGIRNCITCKICKPVSEFYKYKYITKQGKSSIRSCSRCKGCDKKKQILRSKENPEKIRATNQIWYQKNKEKQKEYRKERQKNPSHRANKAKAQRMRKARIRAATDYHDKDIAKIYQSAINWEIKLQACIYCDDPLEIKMHVDHIIPLKLGGKHISSNLQILSARDNLKKGSIHPAVIASEADNG